MPTTARLLVALALLALTGPVAADRVYVSASGSGSTTDGVSFDDEDILTFDTVSNGWSLYFDGSDVGLSPVDVSAFHLLPGGDLLLVIDSPLAVPGVAGTVTPSDILRFAPTSLGENTAGTFELYFDGSDVSLTTTSEHIDALGVTDTGDIIVSTTGTARLPGRISARDEDLVLFTPTSLGVNTAGTWQRYFDGSDVGLTDASEDITGLWLDDDTGEIYLTTAGNFSVSGASGEGRDVFVCNPSRLGAITRCTWTSFFDAGAAGFPAVSVDGVHVDNALATLSVSKTDSPDPVAPGGTLVYTVTVNNAGPDAATNTVATDTLPAGVTFVATSGCDEDPVGVPSCTLGTIAAGASASYTIEVTVDAPSGTLLNSVEVTSDTSAPAGDSETTTVSVAPPDPVAVDDDFTVGEDSGASVLDVIANDTDAAGATISGVTQPANGSVVNNGTDVSYTPDPQYCNDPGAAPTDDFTYTLSPGGSTATVRVTVTCVNDPPTVVAPSPFTFDVTGNVAIDVDAAGGLLGAAVTVQDADGPAAEPFTVQLVTPPSGDISIDPNTGAFTYDPPAGFNGNDAFQYEICDSGEPLPSQCSGAITVTLQVSDMIWFVDASASPGGDGRLSSPFNCLVSAGCFSSAASDGPGDSIFLSDGSYTGGLTLLQGQRLIGDGASGDLASATGITFAPDSVSLPAFSGTDPVITNPSGDGIVLPTDATIRGLTVGNTSGAGIRAPNLGPPAPGATLTIVETSIQGSGTALDIQQRAMDFTFDSIGASTTGSDAGIDIASSSGSFTVLGATVIGTVNGDGIRLQSNPSGTFDFPGGVNIASSGGGRGIAANSIAGIFIGGGTVATNGGRAIDVDGSGLDTSPLSVSVGGGSNGGVRLLNTTGTVNLDGVSIQSVSGAGLLANNAGTLNVTGASNSIVSSNGPAVDLEDTTIGAGGVTFESLSSTGSPAEGIRLDNVGAGSFTVTGDGSLARNGTGGTVAGSSGDGISISGGTRNVTFRSMSIVSTTGDAIQSTQTGGTGGGITLSGVLVSDPGGHGWNATDATGTNRIDSDSRFESIDSSGASGVRFLQNGSASGSLTIDGSEFANSDTGASMVLVSGRGTSSFDVTVENGSLFENLFGAAFTSAAGDDAGSTATVTTIFRDSIVRDAAAVGASQGSSEINIVSNEQGTQTFTVSDNDLINLARANANAGIVDLRNVGRGALSGTVSGNTIDSTDTLLYGKRRGISLVSDPDNGTSTATVNVTIDGNDIDRVPDREGILVNLLDAVSGIGGTGASQIVVSNNTIGQGSGGLVGGTRDAMRLRFDNNTPTTTLVVVENNLVITNNTTSDEVLDFDVSENTSVQATVTGNTFARNTGGVDQAEFDVNDAGSQLCLNLDNNTTAAPTSLSIELRENSGTFTVQDLTTVDTRNGGPGVVDIGAGISNAPAPCATPAP